MASPQPPQEKNSTDEASRRACAHEGDGGHGACGCEGGGEPSWRRMAVALVVALAAEMLDFVAPENRVATVAGMALAASAIGLAGFSVYGAGLRALRHGRLNIEALMTVAVSGAFVIGQWPEAAMVMALYAIAEPSRRGRWIARAARSPNCWRWRRKRRKCVGRMAHGRGGR